MDPHIRTTASNFAILSHFYEPLVMMDTKMKIIPWLAGSWENPDSLTWIFHLRSGVKFHSGKTMTADDVVYSFQRILNHPGFETTAYLRDIARVDSMDKNTVKITTTGPVSLLLSRLRFIPIIPADSDGNLLHKKEDGTGPYRLAEWKPGERIGMIRNENYWQRKPDLLHVEFLLGRNDSQAIHLLQTGQCKFIRCSSKRLNQILANSGDFQILRQDSIFLKLLGFDLYRKVTPQCKLIPNPFLNRMVRRAIHIAIDRQSLVNSLSTYAVPATQPVPPFIFGFNPEIRPPVYDPQGAKTLLRSAGFPDGFEVGIHVRKIFLETGLLLQEQLARVGVRLRLLTFPDKEYFHEIDDQKATLYLNQFGCSTGDAGEVLADAMHTVDPSLRYGRYNAERYSNKQLDKMIEETEQLEDPALRSTGLEEGMAAVMDDLVWIPLYVDQVSYAVHKSFQWQPRADGDILAAEIRVRQ